MRPSVQTNWKWQLNNVLGLELCELSTIIDRVEGMERLCLPSGISSPTEGAGSGRLGSANGDIWRNIRVSFIEFLELQKLSQTECFQDS
jgi:hypothetical protein